MAQLVGEYRLRDIANGLLVLEERIEAVAFDALEDMIFDVDVAASMTEAYNDDTGATRAATGSYVESARRPSDLPDQLGGIAEFYREGSYNGDAPPPPPPGEIALTAYSPTNYSYHLNTRFGMQNAYLADAILTNYAKIEARVFGAIGTLFR